MSNPDGNNYTPTNIFSLIDYENKRMLGEADVGGRSVNEKPIPLAVNTCKECKAKTRKSQSVCECSRVT